jgi:hypothetical protein
MRRPTTREGLFLLALAPSLAALATCATGGATNPKYRSRGAGCPIAIIHQSTPPVPEWDDLGMAEAGCYLDEGPGICLQRLKAEGCRMGGDMIYDVPRRPSRPTERALVFRGHVAHTKTTAKPAPVETASDAAPGPVIPLGSVPEDLPPPATDGGTTPDDGGPASDAR